MNTPENAKVDVLECLDLCRMLRGALQIIRLHKDELCLIDAEIGDGDHGITMSRAMEKMGEVIDATPNQQISPMLNDIAWALMGIDGGAAGPLYGSIFLGMADATIGKDTLTSTDVAAMFEGGLASIQQQTPAREGDKTLLDAFIPAIRSLRSESAQGTSLIDMMQQAALAAREGSEATRNYPARFGRAKFQGDRTIGTPDPGSVSMALVFEGFVEGLMEG